MAIMSSIQFPGSDEVFEVADAAARTALEGKLDAAGGAMSGDLTLDGRALIIAKSADGAACELRAWVSDGGEAVLGLYVDGALKSSLTLGQALAALAQGLSVPGDLTVSDDGANSQRKFIISRAVSSANPSTLQSWVNYDGTAILALYTGSIQNNRLTLGKTSTTLSQPLSVSSGGTGVTSVSALKAALGLTALESRVAALEGA